MNTPSQTPGLLQLLNSEVSGVFSEGRAVQRDDNQRTVTGPASGSSRKRRARVASLDTNTGTPSPNSPFIEAHRKSYKVSRACDLCKSKKAKCSGTLPCEYCTKRKLQCCYAAKYSRGRPPTPPPARAADYVFDSAEKSAQSTSEEDMELDTEEGRTSIRVRSEPQDLQGDPMNSPGEGHNLSRASPELDVAEIEGQYFDPTSGLTFLHRAWKRLATQKSTADNEGNEKRQMWMAAGDEPFMVQNDNSFQFPSKELAKTLLAFYFDICVVTYRFLHQASVTTWLDAMCSNFQNGLPLWHSVGHARASIVLTILAIASIRQQKIRGIVSSDQEVSSLNVSGQYFCAGLKLLSESETGLPRLESAQARIIQVLYLLQTSRMNQGWYIFGSAIQIISALALHRRSGRKRNVSGRSSNPDYIHSQYRKRTFWVAYTIDAYLCVVFGRPRHYHDDDIDQDFPDCINDEDMTHQGPGDTDIQQDCHVESLISHARLAQIIGAISKDVYSTKRLSKQARLAAADRLGCELQAWKANLPPHLGSIRPSSLIPIFRRQAIAMKLAYYHAILHTYRPFLMRQTRPDSEQDSLPNGVTQCLSAAKVVLQTVDQMATDGSLFHAFWWTHYVTFCALAVVYVWEIQQSADENASESNEASFTQLFELAERCHSHLTREMTACSPSQRYSVILEELRLEAKHRSAKNTPNTNLGRTPMQRHIEASGVLASIRPELGQMGIPEIDQLCDSNGSVSYGINTVWNEWQTADWLDLDGSAFGPFSDTEGSPVLWFAEAA